MSSQAPLQSNPTRWSRVVAIALGWTKAMLLSVTVLIALMLSIGAGQDPAGQGMAGGFAFVALLYLLVIVAPALVLAHRNRWIGLSLALLLVPDILLLPAMVLL